MIIDITLDLRIYSYYQLVIVHAITNTFLNTRNIMMFALMEN